jgi:hypothetical protein
VKGCFPSCFPLIPAMAPHLGARPGGARPSAASALLSLSPLPSSSPLAAWPPARPPVWEWRAALGLPRPRQGAPVAFSPPIVSLGGCGLRGYPCPLPGLGLWVLWRFPFPPPSLTAPCEIMSSPIAGHTEGPALGIIRMSAQGAASGLGKPPSRKSIRELQSRVLFSPSQGLAQ